MEENLKTRLKKLELLSEINGLYFLDKDENRNSLVRINLQDFEYINELISPTEYEDKMSFLFKLKNRIPLLKKSSEKKDKFEPEDFIEYS